jgi:hypothetical protein
MIKQKVNHDQFQQNLSLVLHGKSALSFIILKMFNPFLSRCIVWTTDQQIFFFNPTSRTSLWDRPEELKGKKFLIKKIHF